MPHVTVDGGSKGNAVYQVGGKSFVFFRNPRPDAFDPQTGERYDDVIVIWVDSGAKRPPSCGSRSRRSSRPRTSTATCRCSCGPAASGRSPTGAGRTDPGRLAVPGVEPTCHRLARRPPLTTFWARTFSIPTTCAPRWRYRGSATAADGEGLAGDPRGGGAGQVDGSGGDVGRVAEATERHRLGQRRELPSVTPPIVRSDSVGTMPTANALARIPFGSSSTASVRVSWFMPALAAPYAANRGDGLSRWSRRSQSATSRAA